MRAPVVRHAVLDRQIPSPEQADRIVEAFTACGVPVDELIVTGAGPTPGSAIHAAVAAGAYEDVRAAAKALGSVRRAVQVPDGARALVHDELFAIFTALHDQSGRRERQLVHGLRASTAAPWPRRVRRSRHELVEPSHLLRHKRALIQQSPTLRNAFQRSAR